MKKILWMSIVLMLPIITSFTSIQLAPWQNETRNKALKILVISDLNAEYGDTTYSADVGNVVNNIANIKPDLILCGGDMVAGQKTALTMENIQSMWRAFDQTVLQPIDRLKIPFGFTLGNHDASPNFTKDRSASKQFWTDNKSTTRLTFVDAAHYPFYFSYIKNNVFLMSWDATAAKVKPEVYDWMEQQLATKAAKNARLRILLGHLPLYAIVATKNKPGEVNAVPDSALAFFEANGIDLYISGHQHAYYPAQKKSIQLLNLGCIGNGPRPILGHTDPAKKAYTVIDVPVKNPKQFTYRTWEPTTQIEIKLNSLPDSVVGFNGIIKRRETL